MTAALPRPHRFPTFANGDAAAREGMVRAVPDNRRFPGPSNIERLFRGQTSIPQP